MFVQLKRMIIGFKQADEGLALTEYVVLLGVLVAGVASAVTFFGDSLADLWVAWSEWVENRATPPQG